MTRYLNLMAARGKLRGKKRAERVKREAMLEGKQVPSIRSDRDFSMLTTLGRIPTWTAPKARS